MWSGQLSSIAPSLVGCPAGEGISLLAAEEGLLWEDV